MKRTYIRSMLGLTAGTVLLTSNAFAQIAPRSPNPPDQNSPSQFDAQAGTGDNNVIVPAPAPGIDPAAKSK